MKHKWNLKKNLSIEFFLHIDIYFVSQCEIQRDFDFSVYQSLDDFYI